MFSRLNPLRLLSPRQKFIGGASALVGGTALLRGMLQSGQVAQRQQDLIERRKQDLATPMYNPSVYKQVYAEYSHVKTAAAPSFWGDVKAHGAGPLSTGVASGLTQGVSTGIGQALGNLLLAPIEWAAGKGHKMLVTDPKQHAAYERAVQTDPHLQATHQSAPEMLPTLFSTMRKFAPSVATDPLAVRTFLTHGVTTGGNLDFATLKLLAETERLHKARLGGQP